jgi:predicted permease
MLKVLEVTLPLFGLVFCGFFGQRLRLLPEGGVDALNRFVFYFALPAMLFRAIAFQPLSAYKQFSFFAAWMLASLLCYAIAHAYAARRLIKGPMAATVMAMNVTHPNVGYMGLPLALELGQDFVPLMVMAIMSDLFVVVVLSIVLLEIRARRADAGILREAQRHGMYPSNAALHGITITVLQGLTKSPLVLASLLGLLFSVMALPIPPLLDHFSRLLGAAAAPAALFAIGASIGRTPLRLSRFSATMVTWKLLIHPLIAALVMLCMPGIDHKALAIGIVAAALPSASNTFIIGNRYGVDTSAVAQSIVAGSMLAVLTVSFAVWLTGLR